MARYENIAVVRRYNDGVWNEGRLVLIPELCSRDYVIHVQPPSPVAFSIERYEQAVIAWRTAFPDMRWTVEDEVAERDKVDARLPGRGTQTGIYAHPLFGEIPATGRQVMVSETNIYRVVDGKIAEC